MGRKTTFEAIADGFIKRNEFRLSPDDPHQVQYRKRGTNEEWRDHAWYERADLAARYTERDNEG